MFEDDPRQQVLDKQYIQAKEILEEQCKGTLELMQAQKQIILKLFCSSVKSHFQRLEGLLETQKKEILETLDSFYSRAKERVTDDKPKK